MQRKAGKGRILRDAIYRANQGSLADDAPLHLSINMICAE